jgi:hypothetical protein
MQKKTDCMTSAELRAVIAELRPPAVCDLVERDHEVLAARQARNSLTEQLRQAEMDVKQAKHQMDSWRSAHPLLARLHDFGLMPSRFLVKCNEIWAAADTEVLKLAPRVHDATQYARNTENEVESRVRLEQAPVREHIAELERLERQKVIRELTERCQTPERNDARSALETPTEYRVAARSR